MSKTSPMPPKALDVIIAYALVVDGDTRRTRLLQFSLLSTALAFVVPPLTDPVQLPVERQAGRLSVARVSRSGHRPRERIESSGK